MVRDIDQIVATHRLASARRATGLPVWDRKIDIKTILHEDRENTSNEHSASVANRIGALIRSKVPAGWLDPESNAFEEALYLVVEGMDALRANSYDDDDSFSPLEDLNEMLNQLYDFADEKRIWLGI